MLRSSSWLNDTPLCRTAVNSLTGITISPNEMVPLQIDLAIGRKVPTSGTAQPSHVSSDSARSLRRGSNASAEKPSLTDRQEMAVASRASPRIARCESRPEGCVPMAREVIEKLIDDLDGSEATETVSFGLDGASYEIDLSKKNAAAFRKALEPYVKAARKDRSAGGRPQLTGCGVAEAQRNTTSSSSAVGRKQRRRGPGARSNPQRRRPLQGRRRPLSPAAEHRPLAGGIGTEPAPAARSRAPAAPEEQPRRVQHHPPGDCGLSRTSFSAPC